VIVRRTYLLRLTSGAGGARTEEGAEQQLALSGMHETYFAEFYKITHVWT